MNNVWTAFRQRFRLVVGVVGLSLAAGFVSGAESTTRISPDGISGTLLIAGGNANPELVDEFFRLAGGAKARIVVIPTASSSVENDPEDKYLQSWRARQPASVVLLHTRSREQANAAEFIKPLQEANAVWVSGGSQKLLAEAYAGTAVERELQALLKRGGIVGGNSAGAAIMSRVMIAGGDEQAEVGTGWDLLPGVVIDQHFLARKRQARLRGVIAQRPELVGLGIDEETALVVQGRLMKVIGNSTVTVMLADDARAHPAERSLPAKSILDLTSLRRAARARTDRTFPAAEPPVPNVPRGALVIVGGGGMPEPITKKFLELAGGPQAKIVIIPCEPPGPAAKFANTTKLFERYGAEQVRVLHPATWDEVETPAFQDALQDAQAVWFGGGRQWRFVDNYEQTRIVSLFQDVLKRGGVIGGSSAGASIQADFLLRGDPLGNLSVMAEGYERGFGFLPGTGIDQHFAQRKRFADLTAFQKRHPQYLGIGLDEATAIVVQGHVADVLGQNEVHFYDGRRVHPPGDPDHVSLRAGQRYDLQMRQVLPAAE